MHCIDQIFFCSIFNQLALTKTMIKKALPEKQKKENIKTKKY